MGATGVQSAGRWRPGRPPSHTRGQPHRLPGPSPSEASGNTNGKQAHQVNATRMPPSLLSLGLGGIRVAFGQSEGAALMKGGLCVEGGEAACARRRCQGRLGCICAVQERASRNEHGAAGARAKVVGAVAGNRKGRANGRVGAGSSVSRAPDDPLDDFAVGIGVDLGSSRR